MIDRLNERIKDLESKLVVRLTEKEMDLLSKGDLESSEMKKLIEEKGIYIDSGNIEIEVDGKRKMMTTKKEDFGTILTSEAVEDSYGKKKRGEMAA